MQTALFTCVVRAPRTTKNKQRGTCNYTDTQEQRSQEAAVSAAVSSDGFAVALRAGADLQTNDKEQTHAEPNTV
jgi:hypothetical protein